MDELWRLDRGRQAILYYHWTVLAQGTPVTTVLVGLISLVGGYNPPSIDFWTRFILGSIVSTVTIIIVYLIGARIGNEKIGLLSSFFIAFSFEHLRLSRTFMSEPYITLFFAATLLLFLMSIEKPKYTYLVAVSLAIACLIKPTGFALVPLILIGYLIFFNKKFYLTKKFIYPAILFIATYLYLNIYIFSTGHIFIYFFGPLTRGYGALHAAQPIPWLYHINFLYSYDLILFIGALLALGISIVKKEKKVIYITMVGFLALFLITAITFKGNDVFHRHLTTVIPFFAVMAGYSFYNVFSYLYNKKRIIGIIFLLLLIAIPPVNLYIHDGQTCSDRAWIHYNSIVSGGSVDTKTIGLDLRTYPELDNIAIYLYSPFETTVYGSLINYYYTNNFTNFSADSRTYSPTVKFIPKDSSESLSDYSKRNGIEYIISKPSDGNPLDSTFFTSVKTYPGEIELTKYVGPTILIGSNNSPPYNDPFRVIDRNFISNKTYIWMEAENAISSYGVGDRPYGDENIAIYGISSNGLYHFIKNNGTYSTYMFDIPKSGDYRLWIRLGALAPVGVNITGEFTKIIPETSDYTWYSVPPVALMPGEQKINVDSLGNNYAIYDVLLLTDDFDYVPVGISQPINPTGKPTRTIENGYLIWEEDSGNWHVEWKCKPQSQLSGTISSDRSISMDGLPPDTYDTLIANNSEVSFVISNNNTESLSGYLNFSSDSRYINFNLD